MVFRLLYTSDLHGDIQKYEQLRARALNAGAEPDAVIIGGDMLPSHGDLFEQGAFIRDIVDPFFSTLDEAGVAVLALLGNDDLRVFDPLFAAVCAKYDAIFDLGSSDAPVVLGGYHFIGSNLVVDYPFRLKDRCRMDDDAFTLPKQFGTALVSMQDGWCEIEDWDAEIRTRPTLERALAMLPLLKENTRTVYVIHNPPHGIGLDVTYRGEAVGSKALTRFIGARQPLLTLHGHIHESPEVSGKWRGAIGETVCVQPGQTYGFVWVEIELDGDAVRLERLETPPEDAG